MASMDDKADVEAVKAAEKSAEEARDDAKDAKDEAAANGEKTDDKSKVAEEKPAEALEDLKNRANDRILGKSARPTNEEGKEFERSHAYWYYRDLKEWKEEQERQRLIDAGLILPDIPDLSEEDKKRKFAKPLMSDDERLALEMQAKMSKHNADSANERNNAPGGSGYRPGSRRRKGDAPKSDEEIAAEMQAAKGKIAELESEKSFLLTESEVFSNWGFLKKVGNIQRFVA